MAPKLRVQVPLLTGIFNMRFNFITVYSGTIASLYASSPSSKHAVIALRGSLESIYAQNLTAFFGPVFSAFDAADFALFSKNFAARNSYLSSYSAKKSEHFGAYTNFEMYSMRSFSPAFEKNALLYRKVKNFRYNSLIFRANGFQLGSFSFGKLSSMRTKFFRFFRDLSFFKAFVRLISPIFIDRAQASEVFANFFSLFKSSFVFFPDFNRMAHSKKFFKRFNRHKVKFLKQAFLFFFFFQDEFSNNRLFFRSGFRLTNPSSFYLSDSISFSSRIGFQNSKRRRFLPLAIY